MGLQKTLELLIRGRDAATRPLSKVGKSVDRLGQRFSKLRGILGGVGLAVGGATVVGALRSVVSAANEAIKVEARLAAVNRATGRAAGFTTQQLIRQADALQALTGEGDESVKAAQAQLLTFTNVQGDRFKRATELAIDMSRVFEQDLRTSIIQVGKALQEPDKGITALRRSGVSFTQQQQDMIKTLVETNRQLEAQDIILEALRKQFGGAAREEMRTADGQLRALNNSVADLKETIGRLVNDNGLPKFISELREGVELVNQLAGRSRGSGQSAGPAFARLVAGSSFRASTFGAFELPQVIDRFGNFLADTRRTPEQIFAPDRERSPSPSPPAGPGADEFARRGRVLSNTFEQLNRAIVGGPRRVAGGGRGLLDALMQPGRALGQLNAGQQSLHEANMTILGERARLGDRRAEIQLRTFEVQQRFAETSERLERLMADGSPMQRAMAEHLLSQLPKLQADAIAELSKRGSVPFRLAPGGGADERFLTGVAASQVDAAQRGMMEQVRKQTKESEKQTSLLSQLLGELQNGEKVRLVGSLLKG